MNPKFNIGDIILNNGGRRHTIFGIDLQTQEYILEAGLGPFPASFLEVESTCVLEPPPLVMAGVPQSQAQAWKFKVGDIVRCLRDDYYSRGGNSRGNRYEITKLYEKWGELRIGTKCCTTGYENGWVEEHFQLADKESYTESPEIYRAGEAGKAALEVQSKRSFLRSVLGLPAPAEELKPAPNSVFECPYEAYDTKYGDW